MHDSLGKILKERRGKQGYSVDHLSKVTKINKSIIRSFESDNYKSLPSKVYLIGFIKSLSSALNLSEEDNLDLFEQQFALFISTHNKTYKIYNEERRNKFFLMIIKAQKASWLFGHFYLNSKTLALLAFFLLIGLNQINFNFDEKIINRTPAYTTKKPKLDPAFSPPSIHYEMITIKATRGNSWLAYQVNDGEIISLTLQKNKEIKLIGNVIKLIIGNSAGVDIFHKNQLLSKTNTNFKIIKNVLYTVFPLEAMAEYSPPYFVFSPDGKAQEVN